MLKSGVHPLSKCNWRTRKLGILQVKAWCDCTVGAKSTKVALSSKDNSGATESSYTEEVKHHEPRHKLHENDT
jgi:hypothetical protein